MDATTLVRSCIGAWVVDLASGDFSYHLLSQMGQVVAAEAARDRDLFEEVLVAFMLLAGAAVEHAARAEGRTPQEVFQDVALECAHLRSAGAAIPGESPTGESPTGESPTGESPTLRRAAADIVSTMADYHGPVVVRSTTGDLLGECTAVLAAGREGRRTAWGGEVQGDEGLLSRLFDEDALILEFPAGGRGDVVAVGYTDGAVDVQGTGPVPF